MCSYRFIPLSFLRPDCIARVQRFLVTRLGEDWIFLVLLGITMALISWTMDYASAKSLQGRTTGPTMHCRTGATWIRFFLFSIHRCLVLPFVSLSLSLSPSLLPSLLSLPPSLPLSPSSSPPPAYKWIHVELRGNVPLQYLAWVSYPLIFILFSSLFCHLVAPQAIGFYPPPPKELLCPPKEPLCPPKEPLCPLKNPSAPLKNPSAP